MCVYAHACECEFAREHVSLCDRYARTKSVRVCVCVRCKGCVCGVCVVVRA